MSGLMESLKRKIAGAGDLQAVVRSMKALAASNITQYERAVRSLDHYYHTIELGLAVCLRQAGAAQLPTGKKPRDQGAIGAIVFGSDQGLVGRFNEVLADFVSNELGNLAGKTRKIWAVGERINAILADRGLGGAALMAVPTSINGITQLVDQILIDVEAAREKGDVVEVYLFHNRPQSGAAYKPVARRILPLDNDWQRKISALAWPTKNLPEVIEGKVPALQAFIQGYFFVLLFQACAESLTSENASCLASMQRAEKNIEEMLDDLNRSYHRIRQESIDEELFDVISGYEALSKRTKSSPRY
jgi:F-type H+-transporting ATPase subunit gamma